MFQSTLMPKPLVSIVDDNPRNLLLVEEMLRNKIACEFVRATSGREAMEQIRSCHPDLVLLDVMMPEMDGYQVCREMKADPDTAEIPIIFLTAKVLPNDIVHGFDIGAVDYVTKPFQAAELIARVKTQLKIKEGLDTIRQQNHTQKMLIHVLCHDLANPFAALLNCLAMIDDPDKFLGFRKNLTETAENGLNLIDLVRRLQALQEKGLPLPSEPVRLIEMIRQSQMLMGMRLDHKRIKLEIAIPDDIRLRVEPVAFVNTVFNNLISNAVKFSFPDSTVKITASLNNDIVEICVADSGIGMPQEILKNLFDLQKKTSRDGTEGETGTGFGMPLVKRFVVAVGGKIEVTSRDINISPEQHGTEVTIFLPVV